MKMYDKGTAIYISVITRNVAGLAIDPTSIKVSVYDKEGAAKVTDQDMTKVTDVTGNYYYIWQSAESDAVGNYVVKVKAVSGSYTSINRLQLFGLE